MNLTTCRSLCFALALTSVASFAEAQPTGEPVAPPEVAATAATTPDAATTAEAFPVFDSRSTRMELRELLNRHPRSVAVLLKLDPSLFHNETWLATYPELRSFLGKHPEVAQNSSYFLDTVYVDGDGPPESGAVRATRDAIEGITVFFVVLISTLTFAWIIRSLLEHRRWTRATRIQTEMQNKLLDRFTSHDDLVSYIKSASGRDFLASTVSPLPASGPIISRPADRIVGSIQIGVVLLALGLGLEVISFMIPAEVAPTVAALGVMALAAGVGFVAAALAGHAVARKLHLWPEAVETEQPVSRTLTES